MIERFFRLPDYVQHALFAAAVMAAVGILWMFLLGANAHWAGALAGVMLYYGREARDAEAADQARFYDKLRVLAFWKWPRDQLTDFLAPLAGNSVLAVLVEWWLP